jgi:hypothetical protein
MSLHPIALILGLIAAVILLALLGNWIDREDHGDY